MVFKRHAGIAHTLQHGIERAVEIDATAGIEPDGGFEPLADGVQRRKTDAEIGRQADQGDGVDAALPEVATEAGRCRMVVLEEGRIAVDIRAKSLADNELGLGPGKAGVEIRAEAALDTMVRPQSLFAVWHLDHREGLRARMAVGKARMAGGVP